MLQGGDALQHAGSSPHTRCLECLPAMRANSCSSVPKFRALLDRVISLLVCSSLDRFGLLGAETCSRRGGAALDVDGKSCGWLEEVLASCTDNALAVASSASTSLPSNKVLMALLALVPRRWESVSCMAPRIPRPTCFPSPMSVLPSRRLFLMVMAVYWFRAPTAAMPPEIAETARLCGSGTLRVPPWEAETSLLITDDAALPRKIRWNIWPMRCAVCAVNSR